MWRSRIERAYARNAFGLSDRLVTRFKPATPRWIAKPLGHLLRAGNTQIDRLMCPRSVATARLVAGKSMLHEEALAELYRNAAACNAAIVEIGSFVGGATIVMAKAARQRGMRSPIVAIEVGGMKEHPTIPSQDIIRDLRANIASFGVADQIQIIEGWSNDEQVVKTVGRTIGDEKIGLLVIDADGQVERDFAIYQPMLAPNAFVVIDDFIAPGNEKADRVCPWVMQQVADRVLKQTIVLPWGTWFGRYCG